MSDNVVVEVLAAHADHLTGDRTGGAGSKEYLDLLPAYQAELTPLLRLAERVKAALVPVKPSGTFEADLKQDLMAAAIKRAEENEGNKRGSFLRRRGVLIGAAALGSVLSVAGIVAALLLRQRAIARA